MAGNTFTVATAPLVVNGQTLAGGVGLNYDLGPSTVATMGKVFSFINNNNANAQGFLGQTIAGGQAFFQSQISPLSASLAAMTQAQAQAIPQQNAAVLGALQQIPGLTAMFSTNIRQLSNAQLALAQGSLAAINANTASTNSAIAASNKGGGGGCFITTAICEADGLPDDCEALQTLRGFRDKILLQTAEGRALVSEYYRDAPAIVEAIKRQPDAEQIWKMLRETYLEDAVYSVQAGWNDMALSIYRRMYNRAKWYLV